MWIWVVPSVNISDPQVRPTQAAMELRNPHQQAVVSKSSERKVLLIGTLFEDRTKWKLPKHLVISKCLSYTSPSSQNQTGSYFLIRKKEKGLTPGYLTTQKWGHLGLKRKRVREETLAPRRGPHHMRSHSGDPGDLRGAFHFSPEGLSRLRAAPTTRVPRARPQRQCAGGGDRLGSGRPDPRTAVTKSPWGAEALRLKTPPPAPRGPHLQGGDVLVVELVLAVAQHQRRLPHAAFPQQHHLEGVGSARRRPAAAGRNIPSRPRRPSLAPRRGPHSRRGTSPRPAQPPPHRRPRPEAPPSPTASGRGLEAPRRSPIVKGPGHHVRNLGERLSARSPPPSNVSASSYVTSGHVTAAARGRAPERAWVRRGLRAPAGPRGPAHRGLGCAGRRLSAGRHLSAVRGSLRAIEWGIWGEPNSGEMFKYTIFSFLPRDVHEANDLILPEVGKMILPGAPSVSWQSFLRDPKS